MWRLCKKVATSDTGSVNDAEKAVLEGQLQKVVEMLKNYPNEKLFLGA